MLCNTTVATIIAVQCSGVFLSSRWRQGNRLLSIPIACSITLLVLSNDLLYLSCTGFVGTE